MPTQEPKPLPFDWINFDAPKLEQCPNCSGTGNNLVHGTEEPLEGTCPQCNGMGKAVPANPASAPQEPPTASATGAPLTPLRTTPDPSPTEPLPVIGPLPPEDVTSRLAVCKPVPNFPYYKSKEIGEQYFQAYLPIVGAKIMELGFPEDLWPTHTDVVRGWVFQAVSTGKIPNELNFSGSEGVEREFDRTTLVNKAHENIEYTFKKELPFRQYASYVFTDGEEWWDGPEQWFACDMQTVQDAYKYLRCIGPRTSAELRQEIMSFGKSKSRGRPSLPVSPEKQAASTAYREWVESCRQYNADVLQAKAAYKEERRLCFAELEAVKAKYESRLEELSSRVTELIAQGTPRRP